MYEARDYQSQNTDNTADFLSKEVSDDAFWGAKIDWQISDRHLLELLAFSDKNDEVTDIYNFELSNGSTGSYENTKYVDNGGTNWALTYTGYLTNSLSMKVLYGENERESTSVTLNDIDCNRIRDRRSGGGDRGCTNNTGVSERVDTREAARLDFEWELGDHLLRFGMDRETNTSYMEIGRASCRERV